MSTEIPADLIDAGAHALGQSESAQELLFHYLDRAGITAVVLTAVLPLYRDQLGKEWAEQFDAVEIPPSYTSEYWRGYRAAKREIYDCLNAGMIRQHRTGRETT